MNKPTVYLETTIPSFYFEARTQAEMVARRNWTQQWFAGSSSHYHLVTSFGVIAELSEGRHPAKTETLNWIRQFPMLDADSATADIMLAYIEHFVMPQGNYGDAYHLAVASQNNCHFILTWNCRHLANANKYDHMRHINQKLGLFTPMITTPLELMQVG